MDERDEDREQDDSPNPPRIVPFREDPEELRMWLYEYHKRSGTLEMYYELYPFDRPHRRLEDRERSTGTDREPPRDVEQQKQREAPDAEHDQKRRERKEAARGDADPPARIDAGEAQAPEPRQRRRYRGR